MEELRRKIKTIRRDNSNPEHRYFFPEATLFETVSESTVGPSLRDLKIPVHEVRDLADGILRGGRKCFAILVLIDCGKAIPGFFRYDGLQKSCPDDRLPYTSEGLQQIFGKDATSLAVKDFLEKQWEFAIPIMYQNMVFRKLDTQAILPFLREQPAGQGSMGTAWKVEIHPQCHRLPLENHTVIRKQIDCGERDGKVFERELKNLALLTHLKHPNIVQLYCSYTYRHNFNLIFAVADGGSLEGFLTGKQATRGLEGSQLLLALADLASAIDAMHNFTSGALDLSLSGCHHDLAPRNILVHGDTLLLADFGLSTLKNAEEDSLTTFKEVRGSYVAPECQTIRPDGQIKSEEIRRASDIWSFGCILSEVLTYMMRGGPDGVAMFRDKRKFEVTPELIWRRFHKGPGSPSTQVSSWLDDLEADGEPFCVRLVTLIREMLSMDPSKRPRSVRVMTVLRGITILSLAGHVQRALNGPRTAYPSADRILDKMRFQSWLFAFDRLLDKVDQDNREQLDFDFAGTVEILKETRRILEYSAGEADGVNYQRPSLLRYQHAKLMESLHPDYRSIATGQLVSQVLRTKDVEQLTEFSRAIDQTGEKDIGALLAAKRLTELATNDRLFDRPELILDPRTITVNYRLDDIHSLASLKNSSEDVVIEWLRYGEHWADNEIGPELRRRLASVAGLLFAGSTTRIPGTLYCKGVFHDPSNQAFGVVYDRPQGTKPVTLHRLIDEGRRYLPSLEDRLRLAVDICRCIYTFHKIGWLHRNLHSRNVLFFPQDGIKDAKWAQEPRILGFAYSRENAIDSFTNGPDDDVPLRKYQHPEYLTHRERYREEFDYYSVGMILLEIGHWQTLSKLTETRGFQGKSEEQFRRRVIANRVPDLALYMGTRYMKATRRCLEGGFVESSGNLGKESWYSSFQNLVINRIPLME